jgi:hypothetical protein
MKKWRIIQPILWTKQQTGAYMGLVHSGPEIFDMVCRPTEKGVPFSF